jgi:hypothetical protein
MNEYARAVDGDKVVRIIHDAPIVHRDLVAVRMAGMVYGG